MVQKVNSNVCVNILMHMQVYTQNIIHYETTVLYALHTILRQINPKLTGPVIVRSYCFPDRVVSPTITRQKIQNNRDDTAIEFEIRPNY